MGLEPQREPELEPEPEPELAWEQAPVCSQAATGSQEETGRGRLP